MAAQIANQVAHQVGHEQMNTQDLSEGDPYSQDDFAETVSPAGFTDNANSFIHSDRQDMQNRQQTPEEQSKHDQRENDTSTPDGDADGGVIRYEENVPKSD